MMTAHPLSVSRSTLRVEDGLARLEVRMPLAELEHVAQSNRMLPDRFRIDGQSAVSRVCKFEREDYVCHATFLAPSPKWVDCDLPAAVLPHHVHTLHAGSATLVFTPAATGQEIVERAFPWWLLAIPILTLAAIGNSRWRRKIWDRG
jgi:hypothetical protein